MLWILVEGLQRCEYFYFSACRVKGGIILWGKTDVVVSGHTLRWMGFKGSTKGVLAVPVTISFLRKMNNLGKMYENISID